jgi:hypothetical protein
MACTLLLVRPVAMATTQFARVIRYNVPAPWQPDQNNGLKPLRMNWVVVTGKNGTRELRMQWIADAGC